MSKITVTTIAGLTSGGDANTVKIESGDAFNVVSGATTLGGDLTVDTSTLKVDSSNNKVGIGTASPEETLEVVHATAPAIQLNRTNDGGFKSILRQAGNDFEIRGSSGSTKIYTGNADGDSSTARLLIDASGRVTKPANPAFSVRSNGGNNGNTWEAGQDIKFQLVDTDIGSNYATGTGRFTAPVAGYYTFSYIGFGYSGGRVPAGSTCSVQLRKNGSVVVTLAYNEVNSSTGYPSIGGTYSLALSANDYVTIRAQSNGQYADSSGLYTALSGYLVG